MLAHSTGNAASCSVCGSLQPTYTCPRCCVRYCCLACYKAHGPACTEGFYRENTVAAMQGRFASDEQRRAMQDILTRVHSSSNAPANDGFSPNPRAKDDWNSEDGSDTESPHTQATCALRALSSSTIEQLTGDSTIDIAQLPEAEQQALHAALAKLQLGSLVSEWQPWWLTSAASGIKLRRDGTALVSLADASATHLIGSGTAASKAAQSNGETAAGKRSEHADASCQLHVPDMAPQLPAALDGTHSAGKLRQAAEAASAPPGLHGNSTAAARSSELAAEGLPPEPPQGPCDPLTRLCPGPVAPQVPHAVAQLLCAYCFAMRSYNGDALADPQGWLQLVWHLCPSLHQVSAAEHMPASAADLAHVLATQLRAPPTAFAQTGELVRGIAADAGALASAGRGACLCALAHIRRVHTGLMAHEDATKASSVVGEQNRHQIAQQKQKQKQKKGGHELRGRKRHRRALRLAQHKVAFFMSVANETDEWCTAAHQLAEACESVHMERKGGEVQLPARQLQEQ